LVFETGSDNERITELERQLDDIIDSQLNSVGGNENLSIDSTLGQRNDASGDAGGVRSNQPVIHNITEDDESGTPTGVFDKINLISSMIIVDHTSTPIDLRFIQGPAKDGSKIKITVKKDKVLVIKSGGNILTSSDITITDEEFFILVKHSETETGISGGAYKILKVGAAGYDTIQEEGISVTQRTVMNFIGATVTAVDNAIDNRTDITVTAGTSGLLSDLTIDVTKDWLGLGISNVGDLTGVTEIDMDGATATIVGVQRINLFQDTQLIESVSSGIEYVTANLQSHLFKSQNDNIAQFEEAAAGVLRLDMLDHAIKDAKDITFDVAATLTTSGAVPAIGFDSGSSSFIINFPTGAKIAISENNTIGSTEIFEDGIISNTLTADSDLFIGILGTSPPTVTGQFTNDATDVFVFSGGTARNLSDIPTIDAATTELDNLTTTSINAALLPNASSTLDFGSELLPWRIGHFREIEFPVTVGAPGPTTDTQISVNTSNNMAFNNSVNGGGFLYYFEGVNKWSMTSTQLSGDFILLQNSLVFNDSTTDPIGDGELTRNGTSMILQSSITQFQSDLNNSVDSGELSLLKIHLGTTIAEPLYQLNFKIDSFFGIKTHAQLQTIMKNPEEAGLLEFNILADGVENVNVFTIEGTEITANRTFVTFNTDARIASDLKFQAESGSTDLKIFPALNSLGIVVQDNTSFNVGSSGMIAIPIVNSLPASAVAADAEFGDHIGALGLFDNGVSALTLLARQIDGDWASVNLARDTLT